MCFNGVEASYRFGPVGGTPDLELNLFISQGATYFPWQGVGREISEGISFTRGRFTYATYGGFDRFTATDETVVSHFGGIRVFQDNDLIAELTCIPATVDWAY